MKNTIFYLVAGKSLASTFNKALLRHSLPMFTYKDSLVKSLIIYFPVS